MADVYGSNGNDNLVGTNSSDKLYGLPGNDTFAGGPGDDWVWGGAGVDIVKFHPGHGTVKFFDFQDGVDKIDAQGLAFNQLRFSYDSVWKYTWISDPSGARTVGLKNVTPSQVTAGDFINLGSGSGATGSTSGGSTSGGSTSGGSTSGGSTAAPNAPTGTNGFVYGSSGPDVIKLQPGQPAVKWWDFQDGVDKIDAQGLAFNRLGFSYDSVWKYTWILDPNGERTVGLKNITPDKVTAADFINLGTGSGATGGTGGSKTPPGGDNSISARNGMPKIWQDDWAGKLARGDLNPDRFFDPVPGNNNWQSHNSGKPNATAKALVWTSEAADRPDIGKHAAMALTTFKGVQAGYNAFSNASSYFEDGYDKMSVAADFYFPTSYKLTSLTQPSATIDVKNMLGLYAGPKGVGKPGGTLLQGSNENQNATWVEFGFKQSANFGKDGYGGNNFRMGIGATDLNRNTVGIETKAESKIAVPKGQWVRLEGYVQIDTNGNNGIARLYQDGQLVAQSTNLDLGGARYGWKLHGFAGTWMWGGAGEKYVSAQTETFYIKNMRIYDDPPTGEGAVADADDTIDVDSAMAAFGAAAQHDQFDPAEATEPPVIVTADASGGADYLSATAGFEAAADASAATVEEAPAVESEAAAESQTVAETTPAVAPEDAPAEDAKADDAPAEETSAEDTPADAPAEGQQDAVASSEAAVPAAPVPTDEAENLPLPAADASIVAAAAESPLEATEDALAQMLAPAEDPAAFVHIA